jgi:CheY-like chemotaxis protein
VVDDQKDNREIFIRLLRDIGCEVLSATGGAEALRLACEHHPQIIFMDLLMKPMDGLAAARQILSELVQDQPKIVAHTAAALPRYQEAAQRAGCVGFLAKPIRADQLYECLRTHLGVEFDRADVPTGVEILPEWQERTIQLPDDLYARLTTAAELHSTTALKACLQELRQLGPQAQLLGEHIRHLMRSFDMEEVLRLVSRAAAPAPSSVVPSSSYGFAIAPASNT